MRAKTAMLSKSRYQAGKQCLKRLYLTCYFRNLADPTGAAQQARFDAGHEVGHIAHGLFPGGVLVEADHLHHDEAIVTTSALIGDGTVPAIFEGGFTYEDVRVRADVLVRAGDAWDLLEVKSSTKVKPENLDDVAIQLRVLEGCGVRVRRIVLVHLDPGYVFDGVSHDPARLFAQEDVTYEARSRAADVEACLGVMRAILRTDEAPDVRYGRQCENPYPCEFRGTCRVAAPEHPLFELPKAREGLLAALERAGYESIDQIPSGFPGLNPLQSRVRDAVVSGEPYLDPDLTSRIARLVAEPVRFLDFETIATALPIFPGTRPYQVVPFQFSVHTLGADGGLEHSEYLHEGPGDPRRELAAALLDALGEEGSILSYSPYERGRIVGLAEYLPDLARPLLALAARLVDLLPVVRDGVYHPAFSGSFSIKKVLPALCPGQGWDDLEIAEGEIAALSYARLRDPRTPVAERQTLRDALLAYCRRDTEAMVAVYRALTESL
ncbi:MAG: DUF2779 domain-containing protein [Coriobacteriia bacterium]